VSVELKGARVLLTGATGGIGHALARALHGRGARLVLTGRRADVLGRLQAELGEQAEALPADLASEDGVARLAEEAGAVDVLVANAALPGTGRLESFSAQEIDRVLDVNLRAPIQLAHALVPGMRERGAGHVVLVSSLSGKIATAQSSIYCATKFGLRGFGLALHDELHGSGVGVTTVFPGFVREAGLFADSGARLPPGVGTSSPEEVAGAVIRGIERGAAEIDVAPFLVRSTAKLYANAPSLVLAFGRRIGGDRLTAAVARGQRDKRS
jgi:short-subunit dehydrogenase